MKKETKLLIVIIIMFLVGMILLTLIEYEVIREYWHKVYIAMFYLSWGALFATMYLSEEK